MTQSRVISDLSVAMCTHNGQDYLSRQLQSLVEQEYLPAELVICDDASSDRTIEIIEEFAGKAPFQVKIHKNNRRIGVVKNFEKAISMCEGNYCAFCDQDDIWLADKLKLQYELMVETEKELGSDFPLLIHSDLNIINSDGKIEVPSYMRKAKLTHLESDPLKGLIIQNFVTGCSVMVNQALVNISLPIPDEAIIHDWWFALVASVAGKIKFLENPTVLYRKHDKNVIGPFHYFSAYNISKMIKISELDEDIAKSIKQGFALRKRIKELDFLNFPFDVDCFLDNTQFNRNKAVIKALKYSIRKRPWLSNLIYLLLLAKGGYLRFLNN